MSRNTADLVDLATKGRIVVGADADLAIYDTGVEFRIEATRLAHRNPISAYDGIRYGGRVTRSVVRGNAVDVDRPRPPVGSAAEEARIHDSPRPIGPINPPPRLLMGPGPINADPRVLRAMSAPAGRSVRPVDDRRP